VFPKILVTVGLAGSMVDDVTAGLLIPNNEGCCLVDPPCPNREGLVVPPAGGVADGVVEPARFMSCLLAAGVVVNGLALKGEG